MAYVFVFSYDDDNSLNDMIYLARTINSAEILEKTDKNSKSSSIKCFVCNKYPYITSEFTVDNFDEGVLEQMCEDDPKIFEMMNKLKEVFKNSEE